MPNLLSCRAPRQGFGLEPATCARSPAAATGHRIYLGSRLTRRGLRLPYKYRIGAAPTVSPETEEADSLRKAAEQAYQVTPGVAGYEGPPSNQEAAPLGLMPDLEDDPMTMEDAVNEDNPEIRQEMMDDLAIKSGLLPGQPIYPQPLISDKSDFVPFEMVKFAKDEITHAVSVTVKAPVEQVFDFWRERAGYARWFDLIHSSAEVLSNTEDPVTKAAEPYLDEATPEELQEAANNDRPAMRAIRQPAAVPDSSPSFDLPDLPVGPEPERMSPVGAEVLQPRPDRVKPASAESPEAADEDEMVPLPENAEVTLNLFMFYRWGQMPKLELFTSLIRTAMEENKFILEESLEGMQLAAGAFFSEVEEGTKVELRLAYYLPEPLKQYVGPVGTYADVDEILQQNMQTMKEVVETEDLGSFREWCMADRFAAQEQMANMEMLMGADDMEQAVVDSICGDYHRLKWDAAAEGGEAEDSHASAARKSRFQQRDQQTAEGLRAALVNLREVLLGGENDGDVPAYDAGKLQLMRQFLHDKPDLLVPFVRGIERGLAWLDGDDSAAEPPDIIAPREQAAAAAMDAPSSAATDAVGPTESAEGPQGFNEYPADSTPAEGISEGGGQEAEGATARFTTPSGVVGRGGPTASSPGGGSGSQNPPPAEQVQQQQQQGQDQGSGATTTTSPGSSADNDKHAAEEATPSGPVKPKGKRKSPKKE